MRRWLAILLLCLLPTAAPGQGAPDPVARALALERQVIDNWNRAPWGEQVRRLEEALALIEPVVGERDPRTANIRRNLGHALFQQERYTEAAAAYRRAADAVEWARGPNDLRLGLILRDLGSALLEAKAPKRAEPELLRALSIMQAHLQGNDPRIADTLTGLGRAYLETGRAAEAVAVLTDARDLLLKTRGESDRRTVKADRLLDKAQSELRPFVERHQFIVNVAVLAVVSYAILAVLVWQETFVRRMNDYPPLPRQARRTGTFVSGSASVLALFTAGPVSVMGEQHLWAGLLGAVAAIALIIFCGAVIRKQLLGLERLTAPYIQQGSEAADVKTQQPPVDIEQVNRTISPRRVVWRGTVAKLDSMCLGMGPMLLVVASLQLSRPWVFTALILGLAATVVWLSYLMPNWHLWALQNADSWPETKSLAQASKLLDRDKTWQLPLEIMSKNQRARIARLEAWRDQHG